MATTLDNFSHAVREEMIDLDTRTAYLSDRWTDLSSLMGGSESIDIGEFGNLTVEDHVNTGVDARSHNQLTLQTLDDIANTLRIDQARGMAVELRNWKKKFQGGGRGDYVRKVAEKMLRTMRNDRDTRDCNYLAFLGAFVAGAAVPATHVNPAGGAFTLEHWERALARVTSEQGVSMADLELWVHPFGMGHLRLIPEWAANMEIRGNAVGAPVIGSIAGMIPVIMSQSVPRNRQVAITGSAIAANELTVQVAAGHGFVPGMQVYTTGLTTDAGSAAAPVVITAVTATSVTVALVSADAANNGAAGTLTQAPGTAWNMLVNRTRIWKADDEIMTRTVPRDSQHTSDVLQGWQDYGRRTREGEVSSVVVIHTRGDDLSVS